METSGAHVLFLDVCTILQIHGCLLPVRISRQQQTYLSCGSIEPPCPKALGSHLVTIYMFAQFGLFPELDDLVFRQHSAVASLKIDQLLIRVLRVNHLILIAAKEASPAPPPTTKYDSDHLCLIRTSTSPFPMRSNSLGLRPTASIALKISFFFHFGNSGVRILSWAEAKAIADKFAALNPYNRKIVKGSILNLVDANYVDSDPKNPQRQLYGYSIAAKRYALYEKTGENDITIVDPKAHGIGFLYPPKDSPKGWKEDVPQWIYEMWDYIVRGALKLKRKKPSWLDIPQMMRLTITTYNVLEMLGEWEIARPYNFLLLPMVDPTFGYAFSRRANEKILLVCEFSSKQDRWFDIKCVNIHSGKKFRMVDCTKENNPPYNVVFPSQFARLLIEYQEHREAKSLAPDGSPCSAETRGLLRRARIIAGEFRYVGKETDRKWEEGDEISVLEFKATEYGRAKKVVADASIADEIRAIGIRKTMGLTKMSQHTIERLVRGKAVKRKTHEHMLKIVRA